MKIEDAIRCLGIEAAVVTKDDVKQAYKKLIKVWHPDHHIGSSLYDEATQRAQELNTCYEVLACYFEDSPTYDNRPANDSTTWNIRARKRQKQRVVPGTRRYWDSVVAHGFPDPRIFEVFFESSFLVSGGYDSVGRTLFLKFYRRGSIDIYRYHAVPQSIWDGLLAASSQGAFANRFIFSSFGYEACRSAPTH